MEKYLRQLISIEFEDKKEIFTGFLIDFTEDWILLRNNPIDFIVDGYTILRNKNLKSIIQDDDHEFTERVIKLKKLNTSTEETIPLLDFKTIITFIARKYSIFQIAKRSDKTVYLGKLTNIDLKDFTIEFLSPDAIFDGEMTIKTSKVRVIEFDTDYINSLKLVLADNQRTQ
ncbi:hypothetical protein GV828_01685 [Flavobacterium sp. NST-5]|uniref:DUF1854 domain-containing protein n=1 Tax=Flavobacterium ichthyis TaxID=2698827 RepID=A0ABW9Z715_9FLAO|nr:hypothetical protein [Flavobacterium ichthyis]NBL63905.1 hypothetical protein [Flavobacterium ichthyis]